MIKWSAQSDPTRWEPDPETEVWELPAEFAYLRQTAQGFDVVLKDGRIISFPHETLNGTARPN